jgi:uncharacterized membrane protein
MEFVVIHLIRFMDQVDNKSQENATPPSGSPTDDGGNETLMGILAYISILVLIPLLVEKNNPFVKYHVKQGLVLLVIEVGVYVIGAMIWMLWPILQFVHLACVVLSILGIVNVVQKKQNPLPLVGQFGDMFKI